LPGPWLPFPPFTLNPARPDLSTQAAYTSPHEIEQLVARINRAPALTLLLDYDGTLVPFTPTPDMAAPDREVRALLAALAARPATAVHLVSGRPRETLASWLGALPVALHAEHGSWSREPPDDRWRPHEDIQPLPHDELLALLHRYTERTPGSLVERKSVGLAWHYRQAATEVALHQAKTMIEEVRRRYPSETVAVLHGDKVVEFRPAGIHKGLIVHRLVEARAPGALLVAVGDDATDEDMFAALPEHDVGVHIGPRPSRATWRLPDVAACRQFLGDLLRSSRE
jgi:trehalose 6-phosphate synthase/phosphatase